MNKIPTIFGRDSNFKVVDSPRAECQWVLDGEGTATEKLDGTNVRLTVRSGTVARVEKRRNPSKKQKKAGIYDGWYVDAHEDDPQDTHIFAAVSNIEDLSEWPDGEHPCEAIGPKIQGNPLNLEKPVCVPFLLDESLRLSDVPRTYEGLRQYLAELDSQYLAKLVDPFPPDSLAEGVVFHHPDGRMAKIKRKDFA